MTRVKAMIVLAAILAGACAPVAARPGQQPPTTIGDERRQPEDPTTPTMVRGDAYLAHVTARQTGPGLVELTVAGEVPTPCHGPRAHVEIEDGQLALSVWSEAPEDAICVQVIDPFETTLLVDGLAEGTYRVTVGGKELTTVEVGPMSPTEPVEVPVASFEGIFPASSWDEYHRLAAEVGAGHQPWLRDAELVAAAYLEALYGSRPILDGTLFLTPSIAEVSWSGGRVLLTRHGDGAPWVAYASEVAEVDVSLGDYVDGTLFASVTVREPGSVVARAGAFASEWAAEVETTLEAGQTFETVLVLGGATAPGPDAVLVEVRVTDGAGSERIGQWRVDRIARPGD